MKKIMGKVALSAVSLVLIGCGGGGSSSLPATPSTSQMAKITKDNSKNITYSSLNTVANVNNNNFDLNFRRVAVERNLRVTATNLIRDFRYQKEDCNGGGYIDGDIQGEYKGTVTAHSCYQDGVYMNGTVTVDENEDYRYLSFKDFTIQKDDKYIKAKSGNIKLYFDNKLEANKLYVDLKDGSKEFSYFNYNEYLTNNSVKIDGYIKTPCSGGYVKIETKPQVNFDDGNITGKVDISSNNKTIHIDFKGDNVDVDRREVGGNIENMTIDEFSQKVENSCSANLN